jgi:hypothetical protein
MGDNWIQLVQGPHRRARDEQRQVVLQRVLLRSLVARLTRARAVAAQVEC